MHARQSRRMCSSALARFSILETFVGGDQKITKGVASKRNLAFIAIRMFSFCNVSTAKQSDDEYKMAAKIGNSILG
jgi:hypothetical protein